MDIVNAKLMDTRKDNQQQMDTCKVKNVYILRKINFIYP